MSTKNLTTQPKPENILAVLQQAPQPLSSKELSIQLNVVRTLMNPVLTKLKDEGKIIVTGDTPPKFSLPEGQSFQLSAPQAASGASKAAARANVVPITPKNARAKSAEKPAAAASSTSAADIRDSLIQIINDKPQTIKSLEAAYGEDLAKAVMAVLHQDHLIAQEKILGDELIVLSPKGEDLYTKLLEEGKISLENPAKLEVKAEAAPAKSAQDESQAAEIPQKRGPGRPRGVTSKTKAAKGKSGKSAAPKGATAPAGTQKVASKAPETLTKAAEASPAPSVTAQPPASAPKDQALVTPASQVAGNPMVDLQSQLAGLLEGAVAIVVESQTSKNVSRNEKNQKIADDMAAVSGLMLDLGARLKNLSDSLRED